MLTKELIDNIKITLPLIALCLPLFAKHSISAENGCPYQVYMHLDGKCLDISEQGLNNITEELDSSLVKEVSKEIEEVSKELEDLTQEVEEFCSEEIPETLAQIEIMHDMCQY